MDLAEGGPRGVRREVQRMRRVGQGGLVQQFLYPFDACGGGEQRGQQIPEIAYRPKATPQEREERKHLAQGHAPGGERPHTETDDHEHTEEFEQAHQRQEQSADPTGHQLGVHDREILSLVPLDRGRLLVEALHEGGIGEVLLGDRAE
ncbi:hypothetical protein GOTRE_145_01040 [Gordonia terrae NBRC 100016]|uniref:Uncharacterized protein n=1 Tax=Gordonia terrae NBRC 100016 TaxID=1089454 RepID=A0ABQ0HJM5_9ACTN|nr:hypothetical protein GOTRE_145_01040 [Gordonia terrae NBRC 100016]